MRYVPRLDHEQIVEVARQNHALWGAGRSEAAHVAHVLGQLEAAGPELLRYVGLADRRGRVVGSIKRYGLLLGGGDVAGAAERMVGIGAVFTSPAARGRGVASELVGAVMEEARALGYAAALLYSDIEPAFYARLGFVALAARDWSIPAAALPARGALVVRRAGEGDLDRLLGWYEEALRAGHPTLLRPARSPALFRFFSLRNRVGAPWIVRWRGRDAGYVMAGPDDPLRDLPDPRAPGLFWFDEAAAPGVPRERLWATVGALAREAGAAEVYGWLGPDGAPEGATRRARPSAFPMIAPLTPALRVAPRRAWVDSFQHI